MLEDIPHQCAVIEDLAMDALVSLALKDLPLVHLTLWLLRDVCCTEKSSLPQSVRHWQDDLGIFNKSLPLVF